MPHSIPVMRRLGAGNTSGNCVIGLCERIKGQGDKMNGAQQRKVLVLDAMGVLYQACDDVQELLIPYITSLNKDIGADTIKRLYVEASLGRMTSNRFWNAVDVPSENEDDYLSRHRCSDGLFKFLDSIRSRVDGIVCLSNDVSEWSIKLRKRFALDQYISEWFISADIGIRKPDPEIYLKVDKFFQGSKTSFFFFDDNPKNVVAAERIGWHGYVFNQNSRRSYKEGTLSIVDSFGEAESIITGRV